MNRKKIALAAATFFVAITGAFATNLLVPVPGYTNRILDQFPNQIPLCEQKATCNTEGQLPCQLKVGANFYALRLLEDVDVCVEQLTHTEEFIEIEP